MSSPKLAGALLIFAAAAFGQTYNLVPNSLSIQASATGPPSSLSTGCTANANPTTSTGPNIVRPQASGTFLNLTFSLAFTCTGATQAGLTPATGTGSATISFPTSVTGSPSPDGTVLNINTFLNANSDYIVWYSARLNSPFYNAIIIYDFNLKQPGAYDPTSVNPSLGPSYDDYDGCGPNNNDGLVSATGCTLVYMPLSQGVATYYFGIMVEGTVLFDGSVQYTAPSTCPSAQPGTPVAHCSAPNSISITEAVPFNTDPIFALADTLPAFCAFGTYSTPSTGNPVQVFLQLVDGNGILVATSANPPTFPAGSGLSWGGGCTSKNQLVFIPVRPMPVFNIPAGATYNQLIETLYLQAVLTDAKTGAPLAPTSTQIPYKVELGADLSGGLQLGYSFPGSFDINIIDVNPATDFLVGSRLSLDIATSLGTIKFPTADNYSLTLKTLLDFAGSAALLDAVVTQTDANNKVLSIEPITDSAVVTQGAQIETKLSIDTLLAPGATLVAITPRLKLLNGQLVLFSPITLTAENVTITQATPAPGSCFSQFSVKNILANCLVSGTTNTFQFNGLLTPGEAGEKLVRTVAITEIVGGNNSITRTVINAPLTEGKTAPFSNSVTVTLPSDIYDVVIAYQLYPPSYDVNAFCPTCAADGREYGGFLYPNSITFAANAANQVFPIANGLLRVVNANLAAKVNSLVASLNLANSALNGGAAAKSILSIFQPSAVPSHTMENGVKSQAAAAAASPALTGISSTWIFDTAIPHDGSFSATLSLDYSSTQLPDNPNFVESSMQIFSIDPSGAVHTYPTTVNTTNKVATAPIDGLDQYFSLAVVGQVTQTPVMFASAPTGYALVNTGTGNSNLSVTSYAANGVGAPASSVLPAGNHQNSTTPAWLQAWANSPSVTGVSWFDNGLLFAVNPAGDPAGEFLFTDVEYDTLTSTEIDVANTSLLDANITVSLFNPDGSVQGTYTAVLGAKSSFAGRIEGFFPALQPGFTGYAFVASDQTIVASGYRWANNTGSGIAAQPVNNATYSATSLYAPQLGGSGAASTLHLVNGAGTTANITLKAWTATGTSAAMAVQMKLTSGQQYTQAVATVFGIDPSTVGSIEVDTDTPGIFGDVLTIDSSFFPTYAVSIPLSGTPVASSVLPYATSSTTVYVFNPSPSAATVTVTPYNATGTAGTHTSMSVPANGSAAIGVSAGAYATIGSTQPVVAAGWMVVPSGTTTGYLSLPATVSASTSGGSSAPINGGGTTIEFGNVAVGSSATGTLTIYNTGTTSQTISTITTSDPQFTIVSPARPFNIVAGSQQAITIQFAPTSTGEQSALLTITAGGSATLYAPVVLIGIGTPQPSGGSIEFGSVQVGTSTTSAVTITNTDPASVSVTAIASSDPEFTLVSPSLPFTIASGAQQVITVQFLPTSAGDHTATLTFTANGSTTLLPPASLDGTGTAASTGTGPIPVISSVVNGASFTAKLARGAWATIQGTFTATQLTATGVLTLPTSQGGVSVTVGGVPAPIYYTQSGQVNFLVPQETALESAVPVVITVGGTPSAPMTVPIADYAVGMFQYARTATIIDPIIVHLNNSIVTPTNPAVPNETLVIYANGIGKLNNPPATGALSPSSPPATAVDTPTITVGGSAATVLFAGLTPGLFGLVQLNITLPASLPSGALPIVIQFPGDTGPTVNLYVQGNAGTAAPKLGVSGSLSFGSVTVGQSASLTLTVSNSGNAALTVSSITSSNAAFIAGANAFTVQPGSSFGVTVKFSPTSAGAQSGTLTISSNDPSNGSLGVPLSGTGTAVAPPPAPSITTSVTQLAFGSVTVGKTQAMALTINNAGNAALTVSSISIDNKLFTPSVTSLTGAASIAAGGSSNLSVQFAPTAAGPQTGTLTLATNDPAHASVAIPLTGTGVAAAPTNVVLSVDGGTFNNAFGLSGAATAVFVNRLTPPSYPATLTGIQIYFGNRANGLDVNAPITLVVITNPSGSSIVSTGSAGLENLYTSTVVAQGVFNTYNLPTAVTITSGDFVVGFGVPNPAGLFPADEDQVTASQGRSYASTNGTTFTVIDSFGASLAGNFGIRAAVTVGGSSTSSVIESPTGASGQVVVRQP